MPKKSNITFPKVDDEHPDRGLVYVSRINSWYATYSVDGKRKQKSLRTPHLKQARSRRDEFHQELAEKGGKPPTPRRKANRERVLKDPSLDTYIYARAPYIFRIGKNTISEHDTKEEAKTARNKYLKSNKP